MMMATWVGMRVISISDEVLFILVCSVVLFSVFVTVAANGEQVVSDENHRKAIIVFVLEPRALYAVWIFQIVYFVAQSKVPSPVQSQIPTFRQFVFCSKAKAEVGCECLARFSVAQARPSWMNGTKRWRSSYPL